MTNSIPDDSEDLPLEGLSEEGRKHMRRFLKPDGFCFHCGQPADQHHPVGPIVVAISTPEDETHEFCNWECFGYWAARCAGGVLVIDRS
jgi:hypothetical protein